MLILTLRGLWPVVGAAASVLVPLAIGWPIWVALLLLVPALWLAHLVMTWLAIAALRAGTSQHAREIVPDLESLGLPSDPRSPSGSRGSRKPSGAPSAAAVADLARVIEAFGPEDLGAMVFARAEAAPADYETMRASVLTGVVADLRSSGRFEDHVVESHAAVASVRRAVVHAIDRIPDLQPSPEFEAQSLEHASDLARYIVLRPHLSEPEYEALWGPYQAIVPELAAAAGVADVTGRGASAPIDMERSWGAEQAPSKAPTIDEIEKHVLFVLEYDERVDRPELKHSLRHHHGFTELEVDGLVRGSMAKWAIQPLMRRPAPIDPEDIQRTDTAADVVALIARSYGHDVAPTFAESTTTNRFGPETSAVFEVLREARWLPLHAGRVFERRFSSMGDPEIRLMRKAMAESMWAARRNGRTKQVKEARLLVDRAAGRSVGAVHPDNLSYEATVQGGAAGQFAIMAVMAAATRDLVSPEAYRRLSKPWKRVVGN